MIRETNNASKPIFWGLAPLVLLVLTLPLHAVQALEGDAARVAQVIRQLNQEKAVPGIQEFILLEADLNEYGNRVARARPKLGVQEVELDLRPGGIIAARAVLDMDKIQLTGFAVSMFKTLFSGQQTFKCVGRFVVEGKKGRYEVEEASFNDNYVPAWLAGSVIGYLGERQAQVDPTEPFDLQFGIQDIQIRQDEILIVR